MHACMHVNACCREDEPSWFMFVRAVCARAVCGRAIHAHVAKLWLTFANVTH